jgi:hypothetical protein
MTVKGKLKNFEKNVPTWIALGINLGFCSEKLMMNCGTEL